MHTPKCQELALLRIVRYNLLILSCQMLVDAVEMQASFRMAIIKKRVLKTESPKEDL